MKGKSRGADLSFKIGAKNGSYLGKNYQGDGSIMRRPGLAERPREFSASMVGSTFLSVLQELPSPGWLFLPGSQAFMFQDYHQDEIAYRLSGRANPRRTRMSPGSCHRFPVREFNALAVPSVARLTTRLLR